MQALSHPGDALAPEVAQDLPNGIAAWRTISIAGAGHPGAHAMRTDADTAPFLDVWRKHLAPEPQTLV